MKADKILIGAVGLIMIGLAVTTIGAVALHDSVISIVGVLIIFGGDAYERIATRRLAGKEGKAE